MTRVGIVGGTGPESTILYYREIITEFRRRRPGGGLPAIVIDSIDVNLVLAAVATKDVSGLAEYLSDSVGRLAAAGADFVLFAANTPHLVFDDVNARSPVPLLSIVTETRKIAEAQKLRRVALLGTRFTMQEAFYADNFALAGIAVVTPTLADQESLHERYTTELMEGITTPETRAFFDAMVAKLVAREGADGVILGGTELSLLVTEPRLSGVPVLDTTRIHIAAAVSHLCEQIPWDD